MAIVMLIVASGAWHGAMCSLPSSLVRCAAENDVPCIHACLAAGADLESRDHSGRSPLMAAAEAGADEAVETLLAHDAAIEAVDESFDMNALTYATWKGRESTVELLLGAGAKVEPEGRMDSPLFRASVSGPTRIVSLLLEAGASVERRSRDGRTPLHIASCNSSEREKLMLLIGAGSEIDAEADDGSTPLLCAVRYRRTNAVRILLQAGADASHMDKEGNCPLSVALDAGDAEIVDLLRKAKALPC